MGTEIFSSSDVYLEISNADGRYRYLYAVNDDDIGGSDFIGSNQIWVIERQKGDGKVVTGDQLWIRSKVKNKYMAYGPAGGVMMTLASSKARNGLWPIGDGAPGIPILSGQPALFPPIYRGCIWLTEHMNETETVLRIFNGYQGTSQAGVPIFNRFGKDIKFVFRSRTRNEQTIINVPNRDVAFLGLENEPSETFISHYCNNQESPCFLSRATISQEPRVARIIIDENGIINFTNINGFNIF